jgi:hypothetical protein
MRKDVAAHPDSGLVGGRGVSSRLSYKEALDRVLYLKDLIENMGIHKNLWRAKRKMESDVHMLYRLTWFGTVSDVNREVNNGRGPVDFKVSHGGADSSIVEFKYASSSKLERNLRNQARIYKRSSDSRTSIVVIVFFTAAQHAKVQRILAALPQPREDRIVLIDARRDNKPTGSVA